MPIYEYRCTACDHALDVLQKMSAPALQHCPQCGQPTLRKCISAVGFRLKGSGWYETDFKAGNKKNLHGELPPAAPTVSATPAAAPAAKTADVAGT